MLDDYRFIQITALAIGGGGQVVLYALDGSGTVWKLQDGAGEREPWMPLTNERERVQHREAERRGALA